MSMTRSTSVWSRVASVSKRDHRASASGFVKRSANVFVRLEAQPVLENSGDAFIERQVNDVWTFEFLDLVGQPGHQDDRNHSRRFGRIGG